MGVLSSGIHIQYEYMRIVLYNISKYVVDLVHSIRRRRIVGYVWNRSHVVSINRIYSFSRRLFACKQSCYTYELFLPVGIVPLRSVSLCVRAPFARMRIYTPE